MSANLKPTSLNEWLTLLEKRHPSEIELGLDRVAQVARRVGVLQPAPRIISVAGTNGKGSCVAVLESLYMAEGRKIGAYTSPHLLRFNERIRIDGQPLDDRQICSAFEIIESRLGETSLTYFEFTTLAALLLFRDADLDIVVLEVGLGGRLDAVNIVDADVAVVTSIDLDHQAWLGDDRASIGLEKAGIARRGRALVCGDPRPPAAFIDYLNCLGAIRYMFGDEGFGLRSANRGLQLTCTDNKGQAQVYENVPLPRLPETSAACAVQAMICAGDTPGTATVQGVFAQCQLAGRFQLCDYRGRRMLLDVAHNPAAARRLAEKLRELLREGERLYVVFGVLEDKDISGIVEALLPIADEWIACDLQVCQRAVKAEALARQLDSLGASVALGDRVDDALLSLFGKMGDNDLLLVFGSFYTVAEALVALSRFGD